MKDLADAFEIVVGLLEELRVTYAVMGGIAVRIHGIPRPTYDIYFTVSIDDDGIKELPARARVAQAASNNEWTERLGGEPGGSRSPETCRGATPRCERYK